MKKFRFWIILFLIALAFSNMRTYFIFTMADVFALIAVLVFLF